MIYLDQSGNWKDSSSKQTTEEEWASILSDPSCHLEFQDFDSSKMRSLERHECSGAEAAGGEAVTE
jgi:hypothetical protein